MHIGFIGGIGPAATDFYYRGLVARSYASGIPYSMTIAHAHNPPLVEMFKADRRDDAAAVFAGHIAQLKGAGAEVAAVTALAAHFCIAETVAAAPLPVLNAVAVIRDEITAKGYRKLGLLGAGRVIETSIWGALDAVDVLRPNDIGRVGDTYLDMAMRGLCLETERAFFFAEGARLIDAGAEALFLGGTDLFLAFEGRDPGYPVIDGAELHIAALADLAEKGG